MAGADARPVKVVVKVGTSSITSEGGELDDRAVLKLCGELAATHHAGHELVLVCSGAIAAGLPALAMPSRPTDIGTLQAVAAVGQPKLMERIGGILSEHGLVAGQVLLTPHDFVQRTQYLHARETLRRLLDLGVIPVVNENDTVADDEIRYGDNDRLAALVSHLIGADLLVLLTDTPGLFTADPRLDTEASLIEEIAEVDAALEAVAGASGTPRGSAGCRGTPCARSRAGAQAIFPRASRTRSSIATTWSSSRDSGRHEGRCPQGALARARAVRHTTDPATTPLLSHDPRRRPTGGGPPFWGASNGRRGAGEGSGVGRPH